MDRSNELQKLGARVANQEKEAGGPGRGTRFYVEQHHRPQLLYTNEDRPLMEEAWEMSAAHREELAGRSPQAARMVQARPTVMDMLRSER